MDNNIIFIAPDEKLAEKAKMVIDSLNSSIKVYQGSLSKGVIIAQEAVEKGAKIIISRGGTANLIRRELGIPVVEVQFSGFDIVHVISQATCYSDYIGVVGFEKLVKSAERLQNIFPIKLATVMVRNEREVETRVYQLSHQGIKVFVGGAAVVKAARKYGFQSVLLESGKEAIIEAIREARDILKVQLEEKEKAELLKSIIDFAYDGIIGIDIAGRITVFNPVAESLVGVSASEVIGRYINEVIPNTGMIRIIQNGKAELGEFQRIGEVSIVTNRIPIIVNGVVRGAVATFQEVEKIQKIERQIRKKLFLKGHIAKSTFDDIIGNSKAIKRVKSRAKQFAAVDSTVLLMGETGTGKELFAQSIHRASPRKDKPFVAVNCAALPENLLESELFGYVEGAFTGAKKEGKPGLFELAHTGTIFLDEISEMSLKVQARFLRVLQEKEVTRIGDDKVIPVDVRVISATNRDLIRLVQEGSFREDLYYRLSVLVLKVPNLMERKDDIPDLARYFVIQKSKELGKKVNDISQEAIRILTLQKWPGNIRQMMNVIERAVVLCDKSVIDVDIISEALNEWNILEQDMPNSVNAKVSAEDGILRQVEVQMIEKVLEETGGNKSLAAKKLGISVTTLWRRLKELHN